MKPYVNLDAVKNGQVFNIPIGLTMFEQLSVFSSVFLCDQANKLYPQYFSFDVQKQIQDISKEFFGVELTEREVKNMLAGTISWIGLVVPHIVRLMVGRDTRKTIPMCMIFGACFMIAADIISRVFTAAEIPLSAVTGFFGTVVFVVLLFVRRNTLCEND